MINNLSICSPSKDAESFGNNTMPPLNIETSIKQYIKAPRPNINHPLMLFSFSVVTCSFLVNPNILKNCQKAVAITTRISI